MSKVIKVSPEVKDKLDEIARPGQSYDGALRDLLEKAGYPLKKIHNVLEAH